MIHMICINHPAAQNVPRDDKMLRLSGHGAHQEKQKNSSLHCSKEKKASLTAIVRSSAFQILTFTWNRFYWAIWIKEKLAIASLTLNPSWTKKKQHRKKIFHSLFLQKHSQNNWCLAVTLIDQYNINCLRKLARLKVFGHASCARQY